MNDAKEDEYCGGIWCKGNQYREHIAELAQLLSQGITDEHKLRKENLLQQKHITELDEQLRWKTPEEEMPNIGDLIVAEWVFSEAADGYYAPPIPGQTKEL